MPSRCPLPPRVPVGGDTYDAETVHRVLAPYLTDRRRERMERVVAARTFSLWPVLERVHDPGNVNAVLRSAEGLGCGGAALVALDGEAADLVEQYREGTDNAVLAGERPIRRRQSQGAHKWMHVEAFDTTDAFITEARQRGYRIAVTALREDARPIADLDFSIPTALVFGAERDGASDEILAQADEAVLLPIDGFVQSYNVSVAAALALYHARADRIARMGHHGDLSDDDRRTLLAHYIARGVPNAEALLRNVAA
ncbi:MAG: RNA methyltransferase [Bacteroidota bacterium]